MLMAENIHRPREKQPRQETTSKLQVCDLVFVCDPDSGVFEPRYSPNYRIITIHGSNRIEVQDEKGHKSVRRTGHVKKVEPVDKVCYQLPPEEVCKQFERTSKLLIHPKDVPNINPFFALHLFICSFRKCIQHTTRGQSNFPLSKLCCCYLFIVLKYLWQNSITAHIYANCDQGIVTR